MDKKHKGLKKGNKGMDFENYTKKIHSIKDIGNFRQLPQETQKQNRFSVKKKNEMFLEGLKSQNLHGSMIRDTIFWTV